MFHPGLKFKAALTFDTSTPATGAKALSYSALVGWLLPTLDRLPNEEVDDFCGEILRAPCVQPIILERYDCAFQTLVRQAR